MRKALLILVAAVLVGLVAASVLTGAETPKNSTATLATPAPAPEAPPRPAMLGAPRAPDLIVPNPNAPSGLGPATSVSNALPAAPIPDSTGLGPEIAVEGPAG